MTNKMTYIDALNTILGVDTSDVEVDQQVWDKLIELRDSLQKKKDNKKPTKVQLENEKIKERLLEIVQEAPLAPIYIKSLASERRADEPLEFSSEFDDEPAEEA